MIPEIHMVKERINSFNLHSKHTYTVACMYMHIYIHTKEIKCNKIRNKVIWYHYNSTQMDRMNAVLGTAGKRREQKPLW